jgi:hypothetical protein
MRTQLTPVPAAAVFTAPHVVIRSRTPLTTRVARASSLVVLFLLTAEATCRIEDWVMFRTPLFTPLTSQLDLMVRDKDGIHGRPSARFEKWQMNAIGTRGPDASLVKPPGTVRIVSVGASETFGLAESPGREFPRQLEDSLNRIASRACPGRAALRYEVLNAALPGMSLPTIEQDVRNRVRRFGADAIVVYPTPVQYLVDETPKPAIPDSSGRATSLPATRALHPRFLDRARGQVKTVLPDVVQTWLRRRETEAYVRRQAAGWRFTSLPVERLEQFDRDLRTLIGTIRASRATPIVATHANLFLRPGARDPHLLLSWEKFYPRAAGAMIVAFDSAARQATLSVASDSAVTAVDLVPPLSAAGDGVFSDFVHFTDHGAGLVAGALAPAVLSATSARACGRN